MNKQLKKIIKLFLKIIFNILAIIVMAIGWIFVSKKKNKEPDTSWETGRKEIYDHGIEYWENKLDKLNLIQKGIDVLEVGSGNGQWLIAFSKFANHVEGIEPDKEILEYSIQKFKEYDVEQKINVTQAFSDKLPQDDKSFDLIFCAGVFMFTKQKETLNEFCRVLKDDGKVTLVVNGLGYYIMRLIEGMSYLSLKKTKLGLGVIFNTIFKWVFKKEIGTSAVSYNEMKKITEMSGLNIVNAQIWLDQEKYPFEHFGFVTSYAFTIKKVT